MEGLPPVVFTAGSRGKKVQSSVSSRSADNRWVAPQPKWVARPCSEKRTRSPEIPALEGLRPGAPGRRARVSAQAVVLDTADAQQEALACLEKDIKAASTDSSDRSRIATIELWLSRWRMAAFPPTLASFKAVAATLKAGSYRSAEVYLCVYRREAERRGYPIDSLLAKNLEDLKRSCMRGLGGPVRPRPLPLLNLGRLPAGREAWYDDGPINPRAAVLCGAWWLCREMELSTARARMVEIRPGDGLPSATWHLPVSKNDPQALGLARTLQCSCSRLGRAGCPVHCMWDHLGLLHSRFGARWGVDGPDWDLPLFPSGLGTVVAKSVMVKTICHAAFLLGVPPSAPDGSERVSGHSLRVTGAQGLAQLGWDLWTIQLHGRWHSDVVRRYVREAHLAPVGGAAHPGDGPSVEQIVAAIQQKLGKKCRAGAEDIPKFGGLAAPSPVDLAPIVMAEQPALCAEPALEPKWLVMHASSGIYHRIPSPGASRTACGWDFGASGMAVEVPDHTAGPLGWFQLCGRCWPSARAEAKTNAGLAPPAMAP